jgi:hypothetical protein
MAQQGYFKKAYRFQPDCEFVNDCVNALAHKLSENLYVDLRGSLRRVDGNVSQTSVDARYFASRRRGGCRGFPRRLAQEAQQFAVHGLVTGDDLTLGKNCLAVVQIADEPACLPHQEYPGRHVPR